MRLRFRKLEQCDWAGVWRLSARYESRGICGEFCGNTKSDTIDLDLGVRVGLIPHTPGNPLRSRASASTGAHPQAFARGHK